MRGEGRGGESKGENREEGRIEKWGRIKKSQEWDTHLTAPTLKLSRKVWAQGQLELHSEFQINLGYFIRPYKNSRKQNAV